MEERAKRMSFDQLDAIAAKVEAVIDAEIPDNDQRWWNLWRLDNIIAHRKKARSLERTINAGR